MASITFSGLASGIDSDAIIKAFAESRRLVQEPLKAKQEFNDKENSALEEFNSKLLAFRDSLEDFMTASGGAVRKSATVSNSDAVSVSAKPNAPAASTTITVDNLARTASLSFDDRFTSKDQAIAPGLAEPAVVSVTVGSGSQAKQYSVTVTSQTTLSSLVSSINETCEGKVFGSVVNTGTAANPQYILLFQGTETGVEKGSLSVDVSASITDQGIFGSQLLEQAEDAVFQVSGIGQVTRPSNRVSDLISGLIIELKQENVGPVSISITDDAEKTSAAMQAIVESFNDLLNYSKTNGKVERVEDEDGVTNVFGSLARSRLDDQAIQSIRSALASVSAGEADSPIRVFADLGVTTDRDGTLKFDAEKFQQAIVEDPTAVEDLLSGFADRVASTNGVVAQYTKYQGHIEIAKSANDDENSSINDRIERLEAYLDKQTEYMRQMFARLESTMSRLNSDSETLFSVLESL